MSNLNICLHGEDGPKFPLQLFTEFLKLIIQMALHTPNHTNLSQHKHGGWCGLWLCLRGILPHGFLPFAIWKLMDVSVGEKKLACGRQLQISVWNLLFNVGVLNGCLISKLRQSHSTRVPEWESHSSSKLASGSLLSARHPVSLAALGYWVWVRVSAVRWCAFHARSYQVCSWLVFPSTLPGHWSPWVLDLAGPSSRTGSPSYSHPSFPPTSTRALTLLVSRHSCSAIYRDSHVTCSEPSVVTGLKGQTARLSG